MSWDEELTGGDLALFGLVAGLFVLGRDAHNNVLATDRREQEIIDAGLAAYRTAHELGDATPELLYRIHAAEDVLERRRAHAFERELNEKLTSPRGAFLLAVASPLLAGLIAFAYYIALALIAWVAPWDVPESGMLYGVLSVGTYVFLMWGTWLAHHEAIAELESEQRAYLHRHGGWYHVHPFEPGHRH